jgi:hypothetical protein
VCVTRRRVLQNWHDFVVPKHCRSGSQVLIGPFQIAELSDRYVGEYLVYSRRRIHMIYIAVHQGKSGAIGEAKQMFQSISEPTTVTYTCMSQ